MTRFELITSEGYFEASIALELWRLDGEPKNGFDKYETKARKVVKKIMPTINEIIELKSNSTPTPTNETDRFPETLTEGQLKYYNEVSGALKRDYEEKMWLLKQKIMSDKDGG